MESEHPLLSLPESEVGAYYEERALAALGWTPERAPVRELADAYARLSQVLNEGTDGPTASVRLDGVEEAHRLGAWMLIYGFRTVVVARRLLRAFPPGDRVVELGSGIGPFGLVAAAAGHDVELVDLDGPTLAASGPFYRAFHVAPARTRRLDVAKALQRTGTLAVPYAAMEWPGDLREQFARALRTRRAYVVERGTLGGGHFIQSLRDSAPDNVSAPCPPRERCAFAERPRDWCHFTWRVQPGPLTRSVADRAARKWKELHVSFGVFGFGPGPGERVLSVRRQGKQKATADLCTRDGVERLVALRRSPSFELIDSLEPGSAVELDRTRSVKKGDGWRVDSLDTLSVVGRLGAGGST